MTQRSIDTMNMIVNKIKQGEKLSQALKSVYYKRHMFIPYNEEWFDVPVTTLEMPSRAINALMRARLRKVSDVVDYCQTHKITDIVNLGERTGIKIFETILDYCWERMTDDERTSFLIETVEQNSAYLRR